MYTLRLAIMTETIESCIDACHSQIFVISYRLSWLPRFSFLSDNPFLSRISHRTSRTGWTSFPIIANWSTVTPHTG